MTEQKKTTTKTETKAATAETKAASKVPEAEAPAAAKDSRLCKIEGCDRPRLQDLAVNGRELELCGAHFASRRGDG